MINFIKEFWTTFIQSTLKRKLMTIILFFIYVCLLGLVFIKMDVVVTTPGLINNTAQTSNEDKGFVPLTIETSNISGNIFTIGVYSHYEISLFQYLIASLSDDIQISQYDKTSDLSEREEYLRGVIHKEISIKNAIIVAYEQAKLKDSSIVIDKQFLGMRVSAVTKESQSNLEIGDLITKFNGVLITDYQHFISLRDLQTNLDSFDLTIVRDDEEIVVQAKMIELEDDQQNKIYRLAIEALPDYKINNAFPEYTLSDELDSIGGSGGAMLTLSIYNSLLNEDVTYGKTIVGTGTISIEGAIGDIGAVSQKIVTAKLYDVDYFFVNPEDYDEALMKYQEISPDFTLVKVNYFQDIIQFLEGENHE
ncbi:MAG: hypothetical protein AB7V00_00270 [Bacilli bacterium]